MEYIVLVLPALLWGLNPSLAGRMGGKPIQQQIGISLGAFVFALLAFVIMQPTLSQKVIIGSMISGSLWSLGQLLQYKSYVLLGTSRGFSISTGLNLLFNSLVGVIVFHEWSTTYQLILGFSALAVIVVGASCTSITDNKEEGSLSKGVILLIVAACAFTAYSCAPKFVSAGGIEAVLPQAIGMLLGSLILSLFESKDIKKFESATYKNMLPGIVWSFANIAMIYANLYHGVAIGFTFAQMAVVVSAFCSVFILHEQKSKRELKLTFIGVSLMMLGCIMIGMTM